MLGKGMLQIWSDTYYNRLGRRAVKEGGNERLGDVAKRGAAEDVLGSAPEEGVPDEDAERIRYCLCEF